MSENEIEFATENGEPIIVSGIAHLSVKREPVPCGTEDGFVKFKAGLADFAIREGFVDFETFQRLQNILRDRSSLMLREIQLRITSMSVVPFQEDPAKQFACIDLELEEIGG